MGKSSCFCASVAPFVSDDRSVPYGTICDKQPGPEGTFQRKAI